MNVKGLYVKSSVEGRIFRCLLSRRGRWVSDSTLVDQAGRTTCLSTHISRIRRRLRAAGLGNVSHEERRDGPLRVQVYRLVAG